MITKRKYLSISLIIEQFGITISLVLSGFLIFQLISMSKIESNHNKYPLIALYDDLKPETKKISFGFWPGTSSGYLEDGKTVTFTCSSSDDYHSCQKIDAISSIEYTKWRGKTLYTSNKTSLYEYSSLFNQSVSYGEQCPMGKKQCGILDTMNNIMCIDKEEICPINLIIFTNETEPPKEYPYNFGKISFDKTNLFFTNEAINHTIISQFTVGENFCMNPNEVESHFDKIYPLEDSKGISNCTTVINNTKYNPHYFRLDTDTVFSLYSDNGIFEAVSKLPLFSFDKLVNSNISLFFKPFIGYDKKCVGNKINSKLLQLETYEVMINSCILVEVITMICLFPTIPVYCCLLVWMAQLNYQKVNKYSKIRIIFALGGAVELGVMITIACISMENLCIDEVSTMIYKHLMKGKTFVVIESIIKILLLCFPLVNSYILNKMTINNEEEVIYNMTTTPIDNFVTTEGNMKNYEPAPNFA